MNLKKFFDNYRENLKLRKMKYLSDQQGIMNRYLREKDNWDTHIKETKRFILESAKTKEKGTAVVLGSGWLLDLPIVELAELFQEIILIDIVHPKQVLHKIQDIPNITIVKEDITGGLINHFYNTIKKDKRNKEKTLLTSANAFSFSLPKNTDFVISLNIMCQLHIILSDYIKTSNMHSSAELNELNRTIQLSHLNILPKNKTCLITDFEEEILDEHDEVIGINPLIFHDLPEGNFSKTWQWKFDSLMTYRDNAKTYFNTKAIDF